MWHFENSWWPSGGKEIINFACWLWPPKFWRIIITDLTVVLFLKEKIYLWCYTCMFPCHTLVSDLFYTWIDELCWICAWLIPVSVNLNTLDKVGQARLFTEPWLQRCTEFPQYVVFMIFFLKCSPQLLHPHISYQQKDTLLNFSMVLTCFRICSVEN